MENLTQTYGVVKPDAASAPLEGYKVVVFEETMGGTKLRKILNPGDSPVKKRFRLFSPQPTYSCYAVSSDTKLNFDFSAEMTLAALHQHFVLNCTVYYNVSDPAPMALTFKTDPIKRIREEIKKRLQRNILENKIELEDIQNEFYEVKDKILPNTTLNKIREFSGEFGVIIKEIDMTYKIPEKYLEPNRKKEDYFLQKETDFIEEEGKRKKQEEEKEGLKHKHELRKIEYDHEKDELIHTHELKDLTNIQDEKDTHHIQSMEDVKSIHEFRREMPKRLIKAIDHAVDTINSAESLEKVADSSINVIKRVGSEIQNSDQALTGKQIPAGDDQIKVLKAESSSPFEEAGEFLLNVLSRVRNSPDSSEEKKAMLSCITHLLGEIQLEEKANPEMIEKYVKELNNYALKYRKIFTRAVMVQISELKETINELITQPSGTPDNPGNSNPPDTADTSDDSGESELSGTSGNSNRSDGSDTPDR